MNARRSSAQEIPSAVFDAAALWVARRDAGLSAEQERELEHWLAADERHASAFTRLSGSWARLDEPRQQGAAAWCDAQLIKRAASRRRRRLASAAAFAVIVTCGVLWLQPGPPAEREINEPAIAATAPAKVDARRVQVLSDGSTAELNEGAEIVVAFTEQFRRVTLVRGEAHFEVAKNPARPFVVDAAGVEVRAVGTAFAVRVDPREVEVLVTEGRVAVARPVDAASSADVLAGSGSGPVVPAGGRVLVRLQMPTAPLEVSSLSNVAMGERLAWRIPRLNFSATPLSEAVEEINRYGRAVRIVIADESLKGMAMSGNFRADNVEGFINVLKLSGVRAERVDGEIVLRDGR